MPLSSNQLEAFYAVAQAANFTKAAEKLHVTQSALSQRILNLEGELETALFIRDRAGLRMTDAGIKLLRYCQTKDSLEAEFVTSLKSKSADSLSGIIRIAGFSSVVRSVLMPALAELAAKHDALQFEFFTREVDDLLPILKRGEVDFIVSDQSYQREELETVSLGVEKNVLVEKHGYDGAEIYLDHDERDRTTLNYLKLTGPRTGAIRRRYLDDVYGLIDGVKLGYGRCVLPLHLIKKEKVISVLHPRSVLQVPVDLFYFKQPYYSKLHLAVIREIARKSPKLLGS